MSGAPARPKLPQSKSVLYLDNHVPSPGVSRAPSPTNHGPTNGTPLPENGLSEPTPRASPMESDSRNTPKPTTDNVPTAMKDELASEVKSGISQVHSQQLRSALEGSALSESFSEPSNLSAEIAQARLGVSSLSDEKHKVGGIDVGGKEKAVEAGNTKMEDAFKGTTEVPHATAEAEEYYGGKEVWSRSRTYSNVGVSGYGKRRPDRMGDDLVSRNRRLSHDEQSIRAPRRFLIDVEETLRLVLEQEDTDRDFQISIYDSGPKLLSVGTASSNAYKSFDIRGNYMISNLLSELALARDHGRKRIVLDEARLCENPVDRLSRMIKNSFWNSLTRRIDGDGLELICADPKNRSRSMNPLIYVPAGEPEMAEYYREVARKKPALGLEVEVLPPKPDDPEFVKSLNERPGILALAMKKTPQADGTLKFEGIPFVVPGARFNEFYYWDSYFSGLGLLVDGKREMAMNHVEHFIFQIKHYNKVLNGNRSYYLARSQPPFVTDLALQIFNQMPREMQKEHIPWLKRAMRAAIKEYHTYWMVEPALDVETGLSRYRPGGRGIPPETEATHFTHILQPFAEKHGISVLDFIDQYNDGDIQEAELDDYFMHDRAVRESGHDTTYRFEKRCANLATIDLNSLLFKYEHDIATAIRDIFDDELEMDEDFELSPFPITKAAFAQGSTREHSTSKKQTSAEWYARATFRKAQIDRYLWNEGQALYFDYDTKKKRQSRYESVTAFFALWAGCASEHQAERMMFESLRKFEVQGGLVAGTEDSRGKISLDRPNRQWDYPYGWSPHQVMTWVGLERYGFQEECHRLAYRWIYMMTTAFVDYNGVVPEKFDIVKLSHLVDAEYGNQGLDFKMVNREGFAWTNASFQLGLHFLTTGMRRAVAACTPPEVYFRLKPDPSIEMPKKDMQRGLDHLENKLNKAKLS